MHASTINLADAPRTYDEPIGYNPEAVRQFLRQDDRGTEEAVGRWDGYHDPFFESLAREIIDACDQAEMFAPYRVSLWPVADSDGTVGGGLVTVDRPDGVRVCSLHQDLRDWTTDRDATGWRAAYAVLDAIAHAGQSALDGALAPQQF